MHLLCCFSVVSYLEFIPSVSFGLHVGNIGNFPILLFFSLLNLVSSIVTKIVPSFSFEDKKYLNLFVARYNSFGL